MGRLSEALKKSMIEREQQKKLQEASRKASGIQAKDAVDKKHSGHGERPLNAEHKGNTSGLGQDHGKRSKNRLVQLKERFSEFTKSAMYIAKVKDDSGVDPRVVAYYHYQSPIADQYRIIRTNLKSYFKKSSSFSQTVTSPAATKILTISSALHSEGKSVTAANLAVVLAHDLDSKVLLFDGDLRKGSINRLLNVPVDYGLSDVLYDHVSYQEALYPTQLKNLFIMPAGKTPAEPLELLSSKRMKLLMEQLKADSFTYIIIDTPPLSLFSDAGVIGAETDGIVFIVQAYKTPASVVRRAKELAEHSHAKIVGFVLTHTDYHIPNVYGYHQYYKYYHRTQQ